MHQPPKSHLPSPFHETLSRDGAERGSCPPGAPLGVTGDTLSRTSCAFAGKMVEEMNVSDERSSTVESVPRVKKTTSCGKRKSCRGGTRSTKSSKTSDPASTFTGNVEEVIVAHRDRLARFAFDLIKKDI
jgi:hypothetical protein